MSPETEESGTSGEEASATNALATGQRYGDVREGRTSPRFLRDQMCDQDMEPEKVHRCILALLWADAFTTNFDSLLERPRRFTVKYTLYTLSSLRHQRRVTNDSYR